MRIGQFIEHKQEKYFPSNIMQKMRQGLVPDLILFFKKALNAVKASGLQLSFNTAYNKNKLYKTLVY